ncbi:hypothetical protein PHLGIDRAFT_26577 [Phlebiopsis gigantea 11061_1 CR5-6]|uniref:Cytochrome P450 n=1 Tax=Phlebiopsis gigantea (strain 11061_1 CR5-6) TaxID=745531 RepID=A0A0C3PBU0_PHLG1|nr:hypothetical protein PHLGIDRAFT_26577 [Phlebiopsis gigantea 11061_1 CR5-6]
MILLDSNLSLFPLALGFVAAWTLWTLLKSCVVRSPLDNIPGPSRTSFWTGNIHDLFDRHGWRFHKRLGGEYGPTVVKVHGLMGVRWLLRLHFPCFTCIPVTVERPLLFDSKALNSILLKDQTSYEIPDSLLLHMRTMTPLFYHTVHRLRDAVAQQIGKTTADVNVLDWMGRTALELIGQGGLGYSFDPLIKNQENAYGQALKRLLPVQLTLTAWRLTLPYVTRYIPLSIRRSISPHLPIHNWSEMLHIAETMETQSKNIFYGKRKALEKGDEAVVHQIGEGKDIMSILMKANMEAAVEDRLSDEELLGQMSLLVFAATDTTSNSLARTLQILAENPDVQNKLRAEIMEASQDGEDIPYDKLVALPYLDAICRETLRVYPAVTMLSREALEDAVLPLSEPIQGVNGLMISEIPVPKGTDIYLGLQASNTNKALWGDDALEWKPERWLSPLPETLTQARIPGVYSNLMTFNGGARACLEVVLAVMLCSFRFSLGEKEIYWNMGGVNYPTVGKVDNKPAEFLKLQRIDN